jgi:hypothetical protein
MILLCNLTRKKWALLADLSEVNHIIFEFVAAVQFIISKYIIALLLTVKSELRNDYEEPLVFSSKKRTMSSGWIDSLKKNFRSSSSPIDPLHSGFQRFCNDDPVQRNQRQEDPRPEECLQWFLLQSYLCWYLDHHFYRTGKSAIS